jgi:hypothetical protein
VPVLICALGAGCGGARPEPVGTAESSLDSSGWARVLAAHARDGGLDYAGLAADRESLDLFLTSIRDADPASWSAAEQLAFWSNAYNAVVADLVLELYPGIESVKNVDGFFDRRTRRVAGEELTLDQIEGRGRDLGDPRVHFAVVCASTSCPDLLEEPFEAARLDQQLRLVTERFLADPAKGLRYDEANDTLWLSSIFKWYAGDFTGGSTVVAFFARGQVLDWILPHLPAAQRDTLVERRPSIEYLDYDWSLNDR